MKRLNKPLKVLLIIFLFSVVITFILSFIYVKIGLGRINRPVEIPTFDKTLEGTPEGDRQKENLERLNVYSEKWKSETSSETWTLTSFDGLKLIAEFYKNGNSHQYALFLHGRKDAISRYYNYTAQLYKWGLNILMPQLRGHGASEGKFMGMGYYDSIDLLYWTEKIIENDPQAQIAVIGLSMGAATVMMYSGLDYPSNVKCIIEDSGFSSVKEIFKYQIGTLYNLPVYPFINIMSLYCKLINGWWFSEANNKESMSNCKIPMLFIHGERDTTVPFTFLSINLKNYGGPHSEVLAFSDTEHLKAYFTYPEKYFTTLKNFMIKYISLDENTEPVIY